MRPDPGQPPRSHLERGLLDECRRLAVVAEKRLHLSPQGLVSRTSRLHEGGPVGFLSLESVVIDLLDPLEALGSRHFLRRLIHCSSQTFETLTHTPPLGGDLSPPLPSPHADCC